MMASVPTTSQPVKGSPSSHTPRITVLSGPTMPACAASSVACVLAIAQLFVLRAPSAALVPEPVLWLSLLNATVCTVAPVLMVMMAIERLGAPLAAQAGMVGPLSTVILGVWLLGEPFTGWLVVGTALVLIGVWLLAKWR